MKGFKKAMVSQDTPCLGVIGGARLAHPRTMLWGRCVDGCLDGDWKGLDRTDVGGGIYIHTPSSSITCHGVPTQTHADHVFALVELVAIEIR